MESRRCELIEHGPEVGTEIQVFDLGGNDERFIYGRLFPSGTLAVAEGAAWRQKYEADGWRDIEMFGGTGR